MAIQMQTSLDVADNSGARRVEMIQTIGGSTKATRASLGDKIKQGKEELSAQWRSLVHPMLSRFGLGVPGHASLEIGDQRAVIGQP